MIRHVVYSFLLSGILFAVFLQSDGAPATYDQRQEGKYNVQANLENFLFLIATSSSNDLLNSLANQALEINLAVVPPKDEIERTQEATVYETEEKNDGREPYHVEIIRIEKDEAGKTNVQNLPKLEGRRNAQRIDEKLSTDTDDSRKDTEGKKAPNDNKEEAKNARSLWKFGDGHKLHEKENERLVLIHLKKGGESKYSESQQEDFSVKEGTLKSSKQGTSIKKQLSRTEHENVFSLRQEKNDVGHIENKPQELKLLGGGIENCGPGRYRDKLGVCQFDKSFD